MGLSEKEKSRRYRERLKADPDKLAERKRKKAKVITKIKSWLRIWSRRKKITAEE